MDPASLPTRPFDKVGFAYSLTDHWYQMRGDHHDFDLDRPNVIIFFIDQQRRDTLDLHGNPLDLTPNLDRAAQSGTH